MEKRIHDLEERAEGKLEERTREEREQERELM